MNNWRDLISMIAEQCVVSSSRSCWKTWSPRPRLRRRPWKNPKRSSNSLSWYVASNTSMGSLTLSYSGQWYRKLSFNIQDTELS
jgi:hypothetical protein